MGQTFNIAPVSGVVLVKINGVFVPLTQLRQIPQNVLINALHGTLQLITAAGGGPSGAHDAAAKHKPKIKTQKGSFGGAIFKLNQTKSGAGKGLVTLTLVESAFKGAPSYALCKKGGKKKAGDASAAAASSKVLQLLHASAKGKFKTTGKYSAATVRGTKWTIADRCDGTVTHDVTDSVAGHRLRPPQDDHPARRPELSRAGVAKEACVKAGHPIGLEHAQVSGGIVDFACFSS